MCLSGDRLLANDPLPQKGPTTRPPQGQPPGRDPHRRTQGRLRLATRPQLGRRRHGRADDPRPTAAPHNGGRHGRRLRRLRRVRTRGTKRGVAHHQGPQERPQPDPRRARTRSPIPPPTPQTLERQVQPATHHGIGELRDQAPLRRPALVEGNPQPATRNGVQDPQLQRLPQMPVKSATPNYQGGIVLRDPNKQKV